MKKLKLIGSYIRLITCLLLHRNFDKSFTVHQRNVQKLATEIYKVKIELCSKTMLDLFNEITKVTHSCNVRNSLICGSYKIKIVRYGI